MRISDWSSDVCSSDLAEIVEAEPDSERDELVEQLCCAAAVAQKNAFGHLDFEPLRRESALRECRDDDGGEIGVGKLFGRDVDRDLQVRGPAHRFGAGGAQQDRKSTRLNSSH